MDNYIRNSKHKKYLVDAKKMKDRCIDIIKESYATHEKLLEDALVLLNFIHKDEIEAGSTFSLNCHPNKTEIVISKVVHVIPKANVVFDIREISGDKGEQEV